MPGRERVRAAAIAHPCAVVALSALLFAGLFSPVWWAGGLLGTTDAVIYYYPSYVTRHFGWTPLLYSGYPVQGDPQSMFWYPLALLGSAIPGSWNAFVISGYVLAASFSYGYAYEISRSRVAAAIAGVAYGMSGFAIAHLDHVSMLHALAWVPLLVWSLEGLRTGRPGFWLPVGALAVASCALAGHPQIFLYAALLGGAYAVVRGFGAPVGRARYWARAGSCGLLGLGLAAVMWVPMFELASRSSRGPLEAEAFFLYSLRPLQLLQLLFPHLFGGALLSAGGSGGLPYFGPGLPTEVIGFAGLVPVLLAGFALHRARGDVLVRFWAAVTLVAIALAMGDQLPLSDAVFQIPGYDRLRIPTRHLFASSLAIASLAALGVAALERLPARDRIRALGIGSAVFSALLLLAMAVFVLVLTSGELAESMWRAGVEVEEALPWKSPALIVQVSVFVLGLGALWLWGRASSGFASAALVAAVALDLGTYAAFADWRMSTSEAESFALPPSLAALRRDLSVRHERVAALTFDAPEAAAPPNRSDLWKLPGVLGYGPLPLERYAEILGLSAAHFRGAGDLARVLGERDRSLDLLATRFLLVPDDTRESDTRRRARRFLRPTREATPQWSRVREFVTGSRRWLERERAGGAMLYENTRVLPRARVVGRVVVVSAEQARQAIRSSRLPGGERFDPTEVALVEAPLPEALGCSEDECGRAEILRVEDRSVELTVRARARAFLVSSEVHYPGWRAWIDDVEVPIHVADYCLRGLVVPAGEHRVRMEFRSRSFARGAALSVVSLVLLIGVMIAWRRVDGPTAAD